MKTVKVKEVVNYAGHAVKSSGVVNVVFNAKYGELPNTLLLTQFLENDVSVKARLTDSEKTLDFGLFTIQNIQIKRDGNSVIKLSSINTAVNLDEIGILADHYGEDFRILVQGNVDVDEEE